MEVLWQIIRTGIAAIVLVIGAMAVWWWVPKWQMRSVAQQEGVDQSKSRATAVLPRLSQLSRNVKERASPLWNSARLQFTRGQQWLKLRPQPVFFAAGASVAFLLLIFSGVTAAVAAVAAWIALARHFAQTDADRQRRITESFSKAVEQLGSDKLEVRLGGIYSLERISRESPDDYWTVMETLTAFVRERSQRNERERTTIGLEERISKRAYFLWEENNRPQGADFGQKAEELEKLGEPPATDIVAVLTVIKRRSERNREREVANAWRLDLSGAVLKRALLGDVHLEGADLTGAHLERAFLKGAHLEGTLLMDAHFEGAILWDAHLEEANLWKAHFEGADLWRAHLDGAKPWGTHLEGASLRDAVGLSKIRLALCYGDAATHLPGGMASPAHWPPPAAPNEAEDEDTA